MKRPALLLTLLLLLPGLAGADQLTVAVASNFVTAMREIASEFERHSGHQVVLSGGSTGRHFAQIRHGAPFDLFLAADAARPEKLEQAGLIVPGSRFTYALGRLALWSPTPGLVDDRGEVLRKLDGRRLAIANPRLAPYGLAAQQALQHQGLWLPLRPHLVRGENIAQTYHFVHSGNAALGLVARSQLLRDGGQRGSRWLVPADHHAPIRQQVVQLSDTPAATSLLEFLRSAPARQIILRHGYDLAP